MAQANDLLEPERLRGRASGGGPGAAEACPFGQEEAARSPQPPAATPQAGDERRSDRPPRVYYHPAEASGTASSTGREDRDADIDDRERARLREELPPEPAAARHAPSSMQRPLWEMEAARLRLAHDALALRDRLRPSSLAMNAIGALRGSSRDKRDRPTRATHAATMISAGWALLGLGRRFRAKQDHPVKESAMHFHCDKYKHLAGDHPVRTILAGLGLGLGLAFGLGRLLRRSKAEKAAAKAMAATARPYGGPASHGRGGRHGQELLSGAVGAAGATGAAVRIGLGAAALILGGALLAGWFEKRK